MSTAARAAEGISLEAQRARAEAWGLANGYALAGVDIHLDAGLSGGRADNRPGLKAALDTMEIAARLENAGDDIVSLSESDHRYAEQLTVETGNPVQQAEAARPLLEAGLAARAKGKARAKVVR